MDSKLQNTCKDISFALSQMNDENEVYAFLRDLLSEWEIREFANRLQVAGMLEAGCSYKKIEDETKMSSTTIARISKFLKGENHGYSHALSLLQSRPQ